MNLRPMTMADSDKMLEWKNYPETRKFAIYTHDEIKKEDHEEWLKNYFIWFQVIENNKEPIGAVRIIGNELSIWIDRKFWGLGIATRVIKRVSQTGMYARIVNGNAASLRAFVKSGFIPVAHSAVDNCYILEKK